MIADETDVQKEKRRRSGVEECGQTKDAATA